MVICLKGATHLLLLPTKLLFIKKRVFILASMDVYSFHVLFIFISQRYPCIVHTQVLNNWWQK